MVRSKKKAPNRKPAVAREPAKSQQQDSPKSKRPPKKRPPNKWARQIKRTQRLANKAKLRGAKRIQERNALMNTISTNVYDLRHVDSHELGKEGEHFESQHASRDFKVYFHAGFLGYDTRTKACSKLVKVEIFNSLTKLAEVLTKLLRQHLHSVLGLEQEMYEVAGYELCFAEDFICGEVVVQAGQTVLVQSEYMLSAWAEQAYKRWRDNNLEVVVRIAKPGGGLFDPTFRTPKEINVASEPEQFTEQPAVPSPQQEIIGLGIQNDFLSKTAVEKQKVLRRKESRQEKKREEKQRKRGGQIALDTDFIERLMERQHLSDDAEDTEDAGDVDFVPGLETGAKNLDTTRILRSGARQLNQQNEMDLDRCGMTRFTRLKSPNDQLRLDFAAPLSSSMSES